MITDSNVRSYVVHVLQVLDIPYYNILDSGTYYHNSTLWIEADGTYISTKCNIIDNRDNQLTDISKFKSCNSQFNFVRFEQNLVSLFKHYMRISNITYHVISHNDIVLVDYRNRVYAMIESTRFSSIIYRLGVNLINHTGILDFSSYIKIPLY